MAYGKILMKHTGRNSTGSYENFVKFRKRVNEGENKEDERVTTEGKLESL